MGWPLLFQFIKKDIGKLRQKVLLKGAINMASKGNKNKAKTEFSPKGCG